jgi:hypothetical protein
MMFNINTVHIYFILRICTYRSIIFSRHSKQLIKMNCVVAKSWFNYFWVYNDSQTGHSGQFRIHRTNNLDWWPYTPISPVTLSLLQILITFLQSYTVPFDWSNYSRICGMSDLTVTSNKFNLKKETLETQSEKPLSTNMRCQYGYWQLSAD